MLENAVEYIERLGDSVEDEIKGMSETGPLEGYLCTHGTHHYMVLSAEGWEWIQLRYPLSIDQMYAARRLRDPDAGEEAQQVTEAQIQKAREELEERLDDMPMDERRQFRMNLIHMLSREGLIVELDTTRPMNIHGFNIDSRIFPKDDDFSLADFHEEVQTVVSIGWVGKEFVANNFGFSFDESIDGDESQGPDGGPTQL